YKVKFRNTSLFDLRLRRQYTYLFEGFDPSGTGALKLPDNTYYTNNMLIGSYVSDARKRLFYEIRTRSGQYFNGSRINVNASIGYRYQPYGFTSLDVTLNRIRLPVPYQSANLYLIGPRFDFTFTKKLFWTTFVQYNSQIENLNINSRLQWRFAPVSDMFLVYTDNYYAYNDQRGWLTFGAPKVRALVFKFTYWLNI
ncbi:MAG: hypothetical protein OEY56_15160, partial [Cyclobacteriaceae bacterium]|nr:hypothetical protein [Cyclobacteriaceae bacterium]